MSNAAAECEALICRYYQKTEYPKESRALAVIIAQEPALQSYRTEDVIAAIGVLLDKTILTAIGDNAVILTHYGRAHLGIS